MPRIMQSEYTSLRPDSPEALLNDSEKDYDYNSSYRASKTQSLRRRATNGALIFSLLLNVVLAYFAVIGVPHQASTQDPRSTICTDPIWGVKEPLYSPAQDAVRYERRVFDVLGKKTKYHGPPTDETDTAWNLLYPVGETRITKEEAHLIPNWTEEIPGDPNHYIITIDVFHQLHCLNTVRKALSPERYGENKISEIFYDGEWVDFDHADHCLNVIRESLICSADITPNVWQWEPRINLSWPHFDSIHTCRSWDSISEWAAKRKLLEPYDTLSHVGDARH